LYHQSIHQIRNGVSESSGRAGIKPSIGTGVIAFSALPGWILNSPRTAGIREYACTMLELGGMGALIPGVIDQCCFMQMNTTKALRRYARAGAWLILAWHSMA
jgi:hypothetical protein